MSYVRKTDEELKTLAWDLDAGKVFTDRHIKDGSDEAYARMATSVFMVLALAGKETAEQMAEDDIVMLYEYMTEAGPRAINGYPMFMSCRMLNREDFDRLMEFSAKIKEVKEAV